jgi:hypothetical protein
MADRLPLNPFNSASGLVLSSLSSANLQPPMRLRLLGAPGTWNHQCARFLATLCFFSPSGPTRQSVFSFDPVTGASAELLSARINNKDVEPNWNLSPDRKYLATRILRPNQNAAIRVLSIVDGSEKTIAVADWSQLIGIDWASDGKSFWSPEVNPGAPASVERQLAHC